MRAIVSVCNQGYLGLLPEWLSCIRRVSSLPVFVLALPGTEVPDTPGCHIVPINSEGNPFPSELPDHACAEKLRIFKFLPPDVTEILFLDLDVIALNNFWDGSGYFEASLSSWVACPDLFVGYKEKMEAEFHPFDPEFRMTYLWNGWYHYFNTGVFFASRAAHADLFDRVVETWAAYVRQVGDYPKCFDQNMFNYCLIAWGIPVTIMPIHNNCIRQYPTVMHDGHLFLDGQEVNVMHFNGSAGEKKLMRWREFMQALEASRCESS